MSPPSSTLPLTGERAARTALRQAVEQHRHEPLSHLLVRRGLGPYRGYAEVLLALDRVVQAGARLSVIGHSVRGEPIFALALGADPGPNVRTSVVLAGLHPIEWIGVETAVCLLDELAPAIVAGERRAVLAVPLTNPDGFLAVERNLRRGRRRFARHNSRGVDLNRNFDAHWGVGRHRVPWLFRPGTTPSSEPEVAAIAQALGRRRVDRALSLHSFGGAVLYPRAHSILPAADDAEHRAWAQRIAASADRRPYRVLPCAWFGFGLRQGGLEVDWFHEHHGALSLLVECSRGGLGLSPARMFEPFAWFNPSEPAAIARRIALASIPFVRGDRL